VFDVPHVAPKIVRCWWKPTKLVPEEVRIGRRHDVVATEKECVVGEVELNVLVNGDANWRVPRGMAESIDLGDSPWTASSEGMLGRSAKDVPEVMISGLGCLLDSSDELCTLLVCDIDALPVAACCLNDLVPAKLFVAPLTCAFKVDDTEGRVSAEAAATWLKLVGLNAMMAVVVVVVLG